MAYLPKVLSFGLHVLSEPRPLLPLSGLLQHWAGGRPALSTGPCAPFAPPAPWPRAAQLPRASTAASSLRARWPWRCALARSAPLLPRRPSPASRAPRPVPTTPCALRQHGLATQEPAPPRTAPDHRLQYRGAPRAAGPGPRARSPQALPLPPHPAPARRALARAVPAATRALACPPRPPSPPRPRPRRAPPREKCRQGASCAPRSPHRALVCSASTRRRHLGRAAPSHRPTATTACLPPACPAGPHRRSLCIGGRRLGGRLAGGEGSPEEGTGSWGKVGILQ